MRRKLLSILTVAALSALPALPVQAQTTQTTQTVQTQRAPVQTQAGQPDGSERGALRLDARDLAVAQMWGLSDEEMLRSKYLMLGPRGSFSVANLSPVEALGIHARSDAERRRYAELFARAQLNDVQRVLAFQRDYDAAIGKLTAGQPIVSFKGLPKVDASVSAADAFNVPRSQLINGGSK